MLNDKTTITVYQILLLTNDHNAQYYRDHNPGASDIAGSFLRCKLSRPVHDLFLKTKAGSSIDNIWDAHDKTIPLDYNLSKHFTLYGDDKIEALSIFTPDVLLVIATYGRQYDIEITGEYLYIINDNAKLNSKEPKQNIIDFLSYANVIAKEIGDQVDKRKI